MMDSTTTNDNSTGSLDSANEEVKQRSYKDKPIPIAKKKEVKDEQVTIPNAEYEGLKQERDQLRVNLYLIATQLKDAGFNVSDQGNQIQKIGTEITNRLKLSPTQLQMIQQSIGQ